MTIWEASGCLSAEGALRDGGFLDRYVETTHNLETFGAELVGLS